MDDVASALKLDPGTVVTELRSLKPEAQLLLTQGLHTHCRALLSQLLDAGGPLADEDAHGLLAMGDALTTVDAAQPDWHIFLADTLTALGTDHPASGTQLLAHAPEPPYSFLQGRTANPRLQPLQGPLPP